MSAKVAICLIAAFAVAFCAGLAVADARARKRERMDPIDEPYNESDTLP